MSKNLSKTCKIGQNIGWVNVIVGLPIKTDINKESQNKKRTVPFIGKTHNVIKNIFKDTFIYFPQELHMCTFSHA